MESNTLSSPPPSAWGITRSAILRWAAVLALAGYALLLAWRVDACAGGSDSSGYMNHARMLGSGHLHAPPRALPGLDGGHFSEFLYTPLGFVPKDGALVPTYPVGLPLMIYAAHPFVGWAHAGDFVIVLHSLAALVAIFVLGRLLGLALEWCLLAAAVLAASPLFLDFSLQAMSDVPALAWTTWTAVAIWLGRKRPGWAAAAGFIFAVSVLVRPNNVLMVLPLLVAWWPTKRSERSATQTFDPAGPDSSSPLSNPIDGLHSGTLRAFRVSQGWGRFIPNILLFGAGGLPAAIAFVLHSHAAYGHWLTTGYGDASSLFMRSMVALTLRHYARWLPVIFSPGVWLFLVLVGPAWTSRPARFLLVWGLAFLGFYVSYFHTHEDWWYLRFVLPAAPAFILGSFWVARWLAQSLTAWRPVARPAAIAVLILAFGGALQAEIGWDRKLNVLAVGHGEATYPMAMDWLKGHIPADSVLTVMQASGAAFYYTDFVAIRWDQMSPALFPEVVAAAAKAGRPIYAPLFPFETEVALKERMPGRWEKVGQVRAIAIWHWVGGIAGR